MSLLFTLAMAAHARGTHHKLALHAVQRLQSHERAGWQAFFLVNAERYMAAAKKPDDVFQDFKNHVLHPRDNYWGGAVDAARTWYAALVKALKAKAWDETVEAAGILSHYLSDPLHPFHTAQSDAETSVHRACEWSISCSFDALYATGLLKHADVVRRLPRGDNWLARLQCESADIANMHYEKLIAHYDITRGVQDPPSGLDAVSRNICGELLITATSTIAAVLDHAIDEAGVSPPPVSTTLHAFLAALKCPRNVILKRIENAQDRKLVRAIYDELFLTGQVNEALPVENRFVRDAYAAEVTALKIRQDAAKLFPLLSETFPYVLPADQLSAQKIEVATQQVVQTPSTVRVTIQSDVVDAPSIGPKTAERLKPHGIDTISDLIAADAEKLAEAVGQRHITARNVRDWQDQARLVVSLPSLTGGAAQLFVGAGYRTPETLAAADTGQVCADVLRFAASIEGRRILRDGHAPDAEKIATWLAKARVA